MRFIRSIHARFHAFYQRHWPHDGPGFYSYLVVAFLLTLNGLSICIGRALIVGDKERLSKTVAIGIYLCALALSYAVIYVKGERERAMHEYVLHRRKWNAIVAIYAVASLALIIMLAYLKRRSAGF